MIEQRLIVPGAPSIGGRGRSAFLGVAPALLFDHFNGDGDIAGRVPAIGPAWVVTGTNGADMVTLNGEMYQDAGVDAGYATSATVALIGEVGCRFRLTEVVNRVVISGTPSAGAIVGANIYPSGAGELGFTQVSYTLSGVDTLATAATAWAAAVTANAAMIAAGITATANGATVSFYATRSPRVAHYGVGLTTATSQSASPTLADYPTGADFLQTMLHFRLGVDGYCDWTVFDAGITLMQSLTAKRIGLTADIEYTYRCCIEPPYVWGGVWDGPTLLACAVGQDTRIATHRGATCFFETAGTGVLFFTEAWAYQQPSVARATIEAALA